MVKKIVRVLILTVLLTMLGSVANFQTQAASSPLTGKSALFVGDSIMSGWRDGSGTSNGRGWSVRIRDNYGMNMTNAAVAGASFSTTRANDSRKDNRVRIIEEMKKYANYSYDYVVIQGGVNDIMGNDQKETTPLGTMSSHFDPDGFDEDTFAGALEEAFHYAATTFEGARIGFLVTFQLPYANPSKRYNNVEDPQVTGAYFSLAKQICDKWGISYLDFHDGTVGDKTYTEVFYPNGSLQLFGDDVHPNAAGYDVSYGYIAQWMETLEPYDSTIISTTTTTTTRATTTTTGKVTTTTTTRANAAGQTVSDNTTGDSAVTTTQTVAEGTASTTTTDTADGTTTSVATQSNAEEIAPENSEPSEESQGEAKPKGRNTLITVIVCIAVAAVAAVIAAIIFVVYKRRKV